MKKSTFRWGWLVSVCAMTALACTCGALGQAQQTIETAQAVATEVQGLATDIEQSGLQETAAALGTESGDGGDLTFGNVPEDIPVHPDNNTLVSVEGSVSYFSSASFQDVVDFYKQEMPNKGWTEATGSVETADSAVLLYEKDGNQATVAISGAGGQTTVQITIIGN